MNIKALIIIPAKIDSTRLKKKNLRIIAGKTLLEHTIIYAKSSKYAIDIVISGNSKEVQDIAFEYGIRTISRPDFLLKNAEVADVYIDLFHNRYNKNTFKEITHVVGLQPDHPDRMVNLDSMLEYCVKNKYDDLITVNSNGVRNGSVRIVKSEHVFTGKMSRRIGSVIDNCTNVHSEEDLKTAEKNILFNEKSYNSKSN